MFKLRDHVMLAAAMFGCGIPTCLGCRLIDTRDLLADPGPWQLLLSQKWAKNFVSALELLKTIARKVRS